MIACRTDYSRLPNRREDRRALWPTSHYGAHKAASEKFVHSYGLGQGYPICALRPTGVHGMTHLVENSKWFDLIGAVVRGETVQCSRGGKEVHASDVAKAPCKMLGDKPERSRRKCTYSRLNPTSGHKGLQVTERVIFCEQAFNVGKYEGNIQL